MGDVVDGLRERLTAAFAPSHLEIIDDSARHAGHAGARPQGESHFTVEIESAAFQGLSRVARQRLVNQALAEQFAAGLHALSIRARAPGE
ncbi:MAG: BolA family transcriptional regulator [Caulobacteraceae bacterium]|nr:BolA family transcriptional regulator [Caulobacteraceae bacterium]